MTDYNGAERRRTHTWRWRVLSLWIIIFTVIVFVAIRSNRHATNELKKDKASIVSLQRTDCALRQFLLTARGARLRTAHSERDPVKKMADLNAAKGYERLARIFASRNCH